jgi:hypothetical protein
MGRTAVGHQAGPRRSIAPAGQVGGRHGSSLIASGQVTCPSGWSNTVGPGATVQPFVEPDHVRAEEQQASVGP